MTLHHFNIILMESPCPILFPSSKCTHTHTRAHACNVGTYIALMDMFPCPVFLEKQIVISFSLYKYPCLFLNLLDLSWFYTFFYSLPWHLSVFLSLLLGFLLFPDKYFEVFSAFLFRAAFLSCASLGAICGVLSPQTHLVGQIPSHVEKLTGFLYQFAVSEQLWNICVYPRQNTVIMRSYAHYAQRNWISVFFLQLRLS